MSFTIRKLNSSKTLGEEIHELRRATGLTLSEMEAKTKVRRVFLNAFETNSYEKLPETLYAKNYLRNYLRGLGVPEADYYLKRWEEQRGTCDFVDAARLPRQRIRARAFLVMSRFVKIAGVAAVLLAITSYIGHEVRAITSAPDLVVYGPLDGEATTDATIVVTGQTDPDTQIKINGEYVLSNSDGTFESSVLLERGLNLIKIEGAKRYSRSSTEYRRVVLEEAKNTALSDTDPLLIP